MPIYVYECRNPSCGNTIEKLESVEAGLALHRCAKCGTYAHQVMSRTYVRFKGNGWCTPTLSDGSDEQ